MAGRKLLILGLNWPEPNATAAGKRMMQLIQLFLEVGWELTFATTAQKTDLSADLEELGIRTQAVVLNEDSFDDFLVNLSPDVVLFDRFITEEQFGWRVAGALPYAIRLLDTEDLHSLRMARRLAIEEGKDFAINDWLHLEQTKREIASIFRSDLSLIISEFEMQLLRDVIKVPETLISYLPLWMDAVQKKSILPFKDRSGFVFLGNGKHQPNVDAVRYLYKEIWPEIRALMPEAHIQVYGAYLPGSITSLHYPAMGFEVKGYTEDANRTMATARINLAPLRFGAGLKGKLILALQNGTPSVTTTVGAEGIMEHSIAGEFVFDKPKEFAREAVRLYNSEREWMLLQELGFDLLRSQFSGSDHKNKFLSDVERMAIRLEEHRTENFIGGMLHHHTLQSTKYLSKWISCKNILKSVQQTPDRE